MSHHPHHHLGLSHPLPWITAWSPSPSPGSQCDDASIKPLLSLLAQQKLKSPRPQDLPPLTPSASLPALLHFHGSVPATWPPGATWNPLGLLPPQGLCTCCVLTRLLLPSCLPGWLSHLLGDMTTVPSQCSCLQAPSTRPGVFSPSLL